jgi:hypothetical protein
MEELLIAVTVTIEHLWLWQWVAKMHVVMNCVTWFPGSVTEYTASKQINKKAATLWAELTRFGENGRRTAHIVS